MSQQFQSVTGSWEGSWRATGVQAVGVHQKPEEASVEQFCSNKIDEISSKIEDKQVKAVSSFCALCSGLPQKG